MTEPLAVWDLWLPRQTAQLRVPTGPCAGSRGTGFVRLRDGSAAGEAADQERGHCRREKSATPRHPGQSGCWLGGSQVARVTQVTWWPLSHGGQRRSWPSIALTGGR